MPNVISALGLVKDGEKSVLLNLSNARQVDYETLEEMTEAQKQGVIICPDYPLDEGNMIPASAISYGNGSAEDALDKSQAMIATVQPNLTAVKAYAVGEQFVYQGLLYKATAAISSGGTITIGGNCELSPKVTEQIRNTDSMIRFVGSINSSTPLTIPLESGKSYILCGVGNESRLSFCGLVNTTTNGAVLFISIISGASITVTDTTANQITISSTSGNGTKISLIQLYR